jgi:hypothetical protein
MKLNIFDKQQQELHSNDFTSFIRTSQAESWNYYKSILNYSNFSYTSHWLLPNEYINYDPIISLANPWILLQTPIGCVKIGFRKKVFSIDWSPTPIFQKITDDDTTSEDTCVHAWTEEKLIEYLVSLNILIQAYQKHPHNFYTSIISKMLHNNNKILDEVFQVYVLKQKINNAK